MRANTHCLVSSRWIEAAFRVRKRFRPFFNFNRSSVSFSPASTWDVATRKVSALSERMKELLFESQIGASRRLRRGAWATVGLLAIMTSAYLYVLNQRGSDSGVGGHQELQDTVKSERVRLMVQSDVARPSLDYDGSVVWTYERRTPLPVTAVVARLEAPMVDLRVVIRLQKNEDISLNASYTLELVFLHADGRANDQIGRISNPVIGKHTKPIRTALRGPLVEVSSNVFIVGLEKSGVGQAENEKALMQGEWIEIPMIIGNRKADLAFEIGKTGRAALEEAFNAWRT